MKISPPLRKKNPRPQLGFFLRVEVAQNAPDLEIQRMANPFVSSQPHSGPVSLVRGINDFSQRFRNFLSGGIRGVLLILINNFSRVCSVFVVVLID